MFSESFEIDLQVLKVKSNKPSNQPKSTHKCNPITCSKNNNLKPTSSTQSKASRTSMNIMNSLIVRKMLKSRIQEKLERAEERRRELVELRRVKNTMRLKRIKMRVLSVKER